MLTFDKSCTADIIRFIMSAVFSQKTKHNPGAGDELYSPFTMKLGIECYQ
jgi:hypothetical protein